MLAFAFLFGAPAQGADGAVRVSVQPLADVAVTLTRSAPAVVIGLNQTRVATRIAGVLEAIDVEVGRDVAAGDRVASLDCTDYRQNLVRDQAQLQALEARRRFADEQLRRALKLQPTGNISEEQVTQRRAEFDAVEAEIAAQQAEIAISRRQVQYCTISSPFDGVVTRRLANLGEYVATGTPIVEILDTRGVEIASNIPHDAVANLATGRPVFRSDQGEHPVTVRTVLPIVEESSRSREARLIFSGEPALVGTPGRLIWVDSDLALPAHLLVSRDEGLGVFVADGSLARFIPLPDALTGRPAAVTLDPGTSIVIDGRHMLSPGQPIEIVAP